MRGGPADLCRASHSKLTVSGLERLLEMWKLMSSSPTMM